MWESTQRSSLFKTEARQKYTPGEEEVGIPNEEKCSKGAVKCVYRAGLPSSLFTLANHLASFSHLDLPWEPMHLHLFAKVIPAEACGSFDNISMDTP